MQFSLPRFPSAEELAQELALREQRRLRREKLRYYWDKPAEFARDMIIWDEDEDGLTPYQEDALNSLFEHKRYALRGPHGLGKTTLAAISIHWFALTRDGLDWKIPTTASVWRQLSKFLWPEVRKWAGKLNWEKIGRPPYNERNELLIMNLRLGSGEAFAVASDRPAQMEGAHAKHIYYIFDEAKIIPGATFDAAEGAFATEDLEGHEVLALAISTPGDTSGRFYDIHSRKPGYADWATRHVTVQEAIKAKRVSVKWVEARKKQWGEDSAIYKNRVLGEFASGDANSVIPLSWVEQAVARWHEWHDNTKVHLVGPLKSVGGDIARTGEDRTVLALRKEYTVIELRDYTKQSLMETTGKVVSVLRRYKGVAVIDVIGIGAGVLDRLREMKYRAVGFNAATTQVRDRWGQELTDRSGELKFANLRAAAWWRMRELLDPDMAKVPVLLPPNDTMIGELVAPRWKTTSGGKIIIESKDDLRKPERLGHSTDFADAVIQAFALEMIFDEVGFTVWGGGDGDVNEEAPDEVSTEVLDNKAYWPSDFH